MEELQKILAEWTRKPVHTQAGFTRKAMHFFVLCGAEGKAASDVILTTFNSVVCSALDEAEAKEFVLRLLRNVLLFEYIDGDKELSAEVAREITNGWTDTEVMDMLDPKNRRIASALRLMLEYWQHDKEGGFMIIEQPQRASAIAGDYGAYLSRLMAQTQQAAAAHPMGEDDREILKRYCFYSYTKEPANDKSKFDKDESDIYSALSKPRGKAEAFRRICAQYDSHVCAHSKPKSANKPKGNDITCEMWVQMHATAYGVKIPKTRRE